MSNSFESSSPTPKKNFALIGAIGIAISAILLGLSAASKSWFTLPEAGSGRYSMSGGVGPLLAEICRSGECETEMTLKGAKHDAELFGFMGLGFAGMVAGLMIWFAVTFILGLLKSRGNRILGWVVLAFTGITMINGLAFFAMKPEKIRLETGSGVVLMILGSLIGIGACVMSALGAPPKAAPAAPAPQPMPYPQMAPGSMPPAPPYGQQMNPAA
ncbi:MAG: hypothetical protein U0414_00955 [Polyangiaceae bacterium]